MIYREDGDEKPTDVTVIIVAEDDETMTIDNGNDSLKTIKKIHIIEETKRFKILC